MPIAQMKTNLHIDSVLKKQFLSDTASELSDILKKPLPAVMVMLDDCRMYMNNSEDTAFFAEFRFIPPDGYNGSKSVFLKNFADRMLSVIQKYTNVDPCRIYMQFTEMNRDNAWRYTG